MMMKHRTPDTEQRAASRPPDVKLGPTGAVSPATWNLLFPLLLALGCGGGSAAEEVLQVEEEIQNGTRTWSPIHERYIMQATVEVMPPDHPGAVCSGTVLRNNIVLTARHCATTTGETTGPLGTPSTMSVASSQHTPTPGCNSTTCRTVSSIETLSSTQDVAVLILSGNLEVNGSTSGFGMKIEPFAPEIHENSSLLVSGYGESWWTGGSAGLLRQGVVAVRSTNGSWAPNLVKTGRVLETVATMPMREGGQSMGLGDSGGPFWNQLVCDPANTNVTQIPMLLAVMSSTIGGEGDSKIARATLASSFRGWVNDEIFERSPNLSNALTSSSFMSSLELREPVSGSNGPTNWLINANGLSEGSNFNTPYPGLVGTMLLHRSRVYENFDMRVDVSGTDNDAVGLIFWYVDDHNYLRFSVDEQRQLARITRMNPRGPVTLAENANFGVDFNPGIQLRVTTSGSTIKAYVNGSLALTAQDRHIMIGRVGLYENAMSNVAFKNWNVTAKASTSADVPYP
jgi:hypothetical protein